MALRAKERILQRNREIILQNLKLLEAFMKQNKQYVSWVQPQGGTMAVLKLLLPISVEDFAEDFVRSEGVLIMPGSVFEFKATFSGSDLARKTCQKF